MGWKKMVWFWLCSHNWVICGNSYIHVQFGQDEILLDIFQYHTDCSMRFDDVSNRFTEKMLTH